MVTMYLPHLRKASSTSLRVRISMLLVRGGSGNVVLSGVPAFNTTTETYLAVTMACDILSALRAGMERIGPRMNRMANFRSLLGIDTPPAYERSVKDNLHYIISGAEIPNKSSVRINSCRT